MNVVLWIFMKFFDTCFKKYYRIDGFYILVTEGFFLFAFDQLSVLSGLWCVGGSRTECIPKRNILYQCKCIFILAIPVNHIFNATINLSHRIEFTFRHSFFLHVNELILNTSFFEKSFRFFVSLHFLVPNICMFIKITFYHKL